MRCLFSEVIKSGSQGFSSYRSVTQREVSYATHYKEWHPPMSKRYIESPSYSISRETSIDSDRCRLTIYSVLSNKADTNNQDTGGKPRSVSSFILDIKFVGRTSRGHTGGRSHRIFHLPSFCGACLNFSREKDSAVPFSRRP